MEKIKYNPNQLDNFEKDWGLHKKCKEWFYATGVLFDEEGNMYSYQYTLLHIYFGLFTLVAPMIAFTDYTNKKHHYKQAPTLKKNNLIVTSNEASFKGVASAVKSADGIAIKAKNSFFDLNVFCEYGKGAFWHCDNGKLQMGILGEKQTTLYYSWTNMPTKGTVIIDDKKIELKGKTWFDRQGGTYSLVNPKTHWEWFSLRFFDDEEVMLFTFPQDNYFDGTYITKDNKSSRLNNYEIKSTKTTIFNDLKWSSGWTINIPIKEKDYLIEPVQEGHMNLGYFEQLCYVKNKNGTIVGYCFAELLPGVLNKTAKANQVSLLFKTIEY